MTAPTGLDPSTYTCLGLDPSTHTGFALVSSKGEVITSGEIKYPTKLKAIPRATAITNEVKKLILEYKPNIICMEGYSLHSKFNLASMVELGTVLRYSLQATGRGYYEVAPTALKKFVSGKGNCKKDLMILECYKRFNFETSNDNIADALGLAYIGLAMEGYTPISMPKVNMESLNKVSRVSSTFTLKDYPQLLS